MHLSDTQLDRFFDLLDSLLEFANKRLNLVDDLKFPIMDDESEMKAAFVCEMLWENREVIDEFVRTNPRRMSERDLAAIRAWNDALVGDFILVRHEKGQALMMGEAGLFWVAGLDANLDKRLPQAPDVIHATLLPFEGIIITDGLEMPSGFPLTEEEVRVMNEVYEQKEPEGFASTASELRKRASAFNREQRERDFDALMASVELEARQSRDGEQLPEGFHRGALAGLSEEERDQAILKHVQERNKRIQQNVQEELEKLREMGHDIPPLGSTLKRLAGIDADAPQPTEEEAYEDERDTILLNCADALTMMCGLMTIKEAYEAYRGVVLDVVDMERFVATLMDEDARGGAEFVLQEWQGQSYLMHYTISDAYARQWVGERQAQKLEKDTPDMRTEGEVASALSQMVEDVAQGLETELTSLEDYRAHIRECQTRIERRPLDPEVVDGDYLVSLTRRPAVVQLRGFLDAHVPDGQDDYDYADQAVDDIIMHSIDSGDAMGFLSEVEQSGIAACAEDQGLLVRLVENAYAALPSWECNGWSPQELLERLTGRPVYYNARGEMLRPATTDACPCGSGRTYGECHGAPSAH